MNDLILEAHDLWEDFSEKQVLNNLNFKLKRGTFLSIVGENGVGKTTLITIEQLFKLTLSFFTESTSASAVPT